MTLSKVGRAQGTAGSAFTALEMVRIKIAKAIEYNWRDMRWREFSEIVKRTEGDIAEVRTVEYIHVLTEGTPSSPLELSSLPGFLRRLNFLGRLILPGDML